jgi:hypothetical protein
MAIFPLTTVAVEGPAAQVWGYAVSVSKWTAKAADSTGDTVFDIPTYGAFAITDRIRFVEAFVGSSVVGMSYARLEAALGGPDADVSVEAAGTILSRGDRVLIGVYRQKPPTSNISWFFAGYCTRLQIVIGERQEKVVWRIRGPEWIWGEGAGQGAQRTIHGQFMLTSAADDTATQGVADAPAYAYSPTLSDTAKVSSLPAIFNPGGRGNCLKFRGQIDGLTGDIGGYWDNPDRLVNGTAITKKWEMRDALAVILGRYNVAARSGITSPHFDPAAADPSVAAIPVAEILPEVNIEGLGIWAALRAICGPKYGFWVDPAPASGTAFAGFSLFFFSRSTGAAANFTIDPRYTPGINSTGNVARLDLTSDIEKSYSKVRVYGKRLFHMSLRYLGWDTTASVAKINLLQHGWSKGDMDLAAYASQTNPRYEAGSAEPVKKGRWEITPITIDKMGKAEEWRRKFTSSGKDYEANRHCCRLFVWNEAGELRGKAADEATQPWYYNATTASGLAGVAFNWVAPDVKTVFGLTSATRRRRPLGDGKWRDSKLDTFRRIRPMLFIAYAKPDGSVSPWFKVQTSKYRVDEERAAVWITVDDLSVWAPFDREQNEDDNLPNDGRSFATLLYQGVLRMALEGCIEGDDANLYVSPMPADAGTPFFREYGLRGGGSFIKMSEYDGGDGFVLTAPGPMVDDTAEATAMATQFLDAAKDAQVHTSIMVESVIPRRLIGQTIASIAGRNISLLSGQSGMNGRPAQIVGYRMDAESNKWEYLTESAALAAKATLRRATSDHRHMARERDRETRKNLNPRQSDLNRY